MSTLDALAEAVKADPKTIDKIPYTQFLSLINQTNVPPGAYVTINEWLAHGHITAESRLLELACTTGFSVRELVKRSGAQGIGIDICSESVERAALNASYLAPHLQLGYKKHDAQKANELLLKHTTSHVIIGASLRFIDNAQETPFLEDLFNSTPHMVTLLSCEFFAPSGLPRALLNDCEEIFGVTPTALTYKQVMAPYTKLRKTYEIERAMHLETDEELAHYCRSTISRFAAELEVQEGNITNHAYARLLKIKSMSNELRKHQRYVTLVHEYDPEEFGKRYTELF